MKLLDTIGATEWISGWKTVSCARPRCGRWITQRYLDVRRVGVTMDGTWYCSYGCFQSFAEEQLRKLLASTSSGPSSRATRMPLGLMLVNRGLLTAEQYREMIERQRASGEEMGYLLTRLGLLTEKQITAARAAQWGCPVFSLGGPLIDERVQIPPTLMRLASMAPLHFVSGHRKLLVGFVNGIEYGPLYAVEQMLGCTAQACLIPPSDFRTLLQQRNEQEGPEELTFEGRNIAAEMGRIVCDYGKLVNAEEVAMRRCRDYLWTRLKSGDRVTDLLFRAG